MSQLQQGQGQGSTAPQQRAFASRLQSCVQHTALVRCLAPKNTADAVNVLSLQLSEQSVVQFEDELLQALAQSVMPMDRLCDSAEKAAALSASLQEHPARQSEDLLAQELLSWFKHDFFTWVGHAASYTLLSHTCSKRLDGTSLSSSSCCCLFRKSVLLQQLRPRSPSITSHLGEVLTNLCLCKQVPQSM